eukprot:8575490-Karenia_brevis.AAC.1
MSVEHNGKYGCVLGRVRAVSNKTGKVNRDIKCYAKFAFCHKKSAWVEETHAVSYQTMQRVNQAWDWGTNDQYHMYRCLFAKIVGETL